MRSLARNWAFYCMPLALVGTAAAAIIAGGFLGWTIVAVCAAMTGVYLWALLANAAQRPRSARATLTSRAS